MIVPNRWAITISVLPRTSSFRDVCITASLSGSVNAVASSSTTTGLFFRIARAIAIRCLSPPERLPPPSPAKVS